MSEEQIWENWRRTISDHIFVYLLLTNSDYLFDIFLHMHLEDPVICTLGIWDDEVGDSVARSLGQSCP